MGHVSREDTVPDLNEQEDTRSGEDLQKATASISHLNPNRTHVQIQPISTQGGGVILTPLPNLQFFEYGKVSDI